MSMLALCCSMVGDSRITPCVAKMVMTSTFFTIVKFQVLKVYVTLMLLSVVIIVKPLTHFYIILEATVNVSQVYCMCVLVKT